MLVTIALVGCQSAGRTARNSGARITRHASDRARTVSIRRLVCIYEARPWLNLDTAGDRDPEGIWFRVFLDPGTGRGVHAAGTFHVEMYRIDRVPDAPPERTLVSDWHYPSHELPTIGSPGLLGEGYVLMLRWADKGLVGREVELITHFEDALGNVVRCGTKRLRIPKYGA
jgi:hypothetical protein